MHTNRDFFLLNWIGYSIYNNRQLENANAVLGIALSFVWGRARCKLLRMKYEIFKKKNILQLYNMDSLKENCQFFID